MTPQGNRTAIPRWDSAVYHWYFSACLNERRHLKNRAGTLGLNYTVLLLWDPSQLWVFPSYSVLLRQTTLSLWSSRPFAGEISILFVEFCFSEAFKKGLWSQINAKADELDESSLVTHVALKRAHGLNCLVAAVSHSGSRVRGCSQRMCISEMTIPEVTAAAFCNVVLQSREPVQMYLPECEK